jgi:4-cresol dehydrogenase (hydroxylating)
LTWIRSVRRLCAAAAVCESVLDLLEGIPNRAHITGVDWRDKRTNAQNSSDPRNAGLIWASPVVPATLHDVKRVVELMEPIFNRFGFDLLITLSSVTERSLCCVTSINYDKSDLADVNRARQCYQQLMANLIETGYLPYRTASVNQASCEKADRSDSPRAHCSLGAEAR